MSGRKLVDEDDPMVHELDKSKGLDGDRPAKLEFQSMWDADDWDEYGPDENMLGSEEED